MRILAMFKVFFGKNKKRYENLEMMVLAIIVGVITGIVSIIFNKSLKMFRDIIFALPSVVGEFTMKEKFIIVPLFGGFLVGLINKYLINANDRGFGVSRVMEELRDISHLIMKPKSVLIKTLGTIVTLGSGLSAGSQGPIVHLGGAIGSNIGYRFGYSNKKIGILIGCGVAGGMAGVFNTPIAATLFVLEVLMHKDHLEYFSAIVISSITSIIITRWVVGDNQILAIAGDFQLKNYHELIYYLLLGIVLGLLAGFSNAPITATIMLLELTNSYSIIFPLLVVLTVSSAVANVICEENIFSMSLKKDKNFT